MFPKLYVLNMGLFVHTVIFYKELSLVELLGFVIKLFLPPVMTHAMPKTRSNSYSCTEMSVTMVLLSATLRWLSAGLV